MLRNFIRGFENALPNDECDKLIEWFERDDHTGKTVEANRVSRKDKQMWMDEKYPLYPVLQKAKFDMLYAYTNEFPFVYRGSKKSLESSESKIQKTMPMGGGFITSMLRILTMQTRHELWSGRYISTMFLMEKVRQSSYMRRYECNRAKEWAASFQPHGCISIGVTLFIHTRSILRQDGIGILKRRP